MVNIGDSITISIIVIGLYFHKLKSNYKIILEVFNNGIRKQLHKRKAQYHVEYCNVY